MIGFHPSPVLPAALLLGLTGCSVPVKVPEIPVLDRQDFAPARIAKEPAEPPRATVEIPVPLPLPGQLKPVETPADPPKDKTSPTERIDQANETARVEPVKDGYINAIQNYPYTEGALYQVYAAVSQVTEIALEPGEKLVSFSSGDTLRWVVGDTTSGEGAGGRMHLLIKPVHPGLRTNGLITTDRRSYHLELHSTEKTYMASVSWTYRRASFSLCADGRRRPTLRKTPSPRRISTSPASTSVTASKGMRPGDQDRSSMMDRRSTSNFLQA